ncbi:TPA: hypothetical protein U1323_000880 [Streptococcus suis]|nr:hypothetical protein [Streptococcus suis]HEM5222229.1 hypothetical protein [Streptococcus suis]HEM5224285.1 hypothetical protein [Streptococcus suis]
MKNISKMKLPIQLDTKLFSKLSFSFISAKEWYEYSQGQKNSKPSGITVSAVIIEDNIVLDGYEPHSNEFEKLTFNVRNETNLEKFKHREIIIPYEFEKISVYGEYQNQLSIICKLATEAEYKQMIANKATQTTAHRQSLPKRDQ